MMLVTTETTPTAKYDTAPSSTKYDTVKPSLPTEPTFASTLNADEESSTIMYRKTGVNYPFTRSANDATTPVLTDNIIRISPVSPSCQNIVSKLDNLFVVRV